MQNNGFVNGVRATLTEDDVKRHRTYAAYACNVQEESATVALEEGVSAVYNFNNRKMYHLMLWYSFLLRVSSIWETTNRAIASKVFKYKFCPSKSVW